MLGLEEPHELRVGDLDLEVRERLPDQAGVLDLLEGSGDPEERFEPLAEVLSDLVGREAVAAERREACAEGRVHELLVEPEVHQRVAPVEEDRLEHGARHRLRCRHQERGLRPSSV
jgi:hypothetical protein